MEEKRKREREREREKERGAAYNRRFTELFSSLSTGLSFSHSRMETAVSGNHCNDGECLNFVARLSFTDEE